jgi:hypothetical protein
VMFGLKTKVALDEHKHAASLPPDRVANLGNVTGDEVKLA